MPSICEVTYDDDYVYKPCKGEELELLTHDGWELVSRYQDSSQAVREDEHLVTPGEQWGDKYKTAAFGAVTHTTYFLVRRLRETYNQIAELTMLFNAERSINANLLAALKVADEKVELQTKRLDAALKDKRSLLDQNAELSNRLRAMEADLARIRGAFGEKAIKEVLAVEVKP